MSSVESCRSSTSAKPTRVTYLPPGGAGGKGGGGEGGVGDGDGGGDAAGGEATGGGGLAFEGYHLKGCADSCTAADWCVAFTFTNAT